MADNVAEHRAPSDTTVGQRQVILIHNVIQTEPRVKKRSVHIIVATTTTVVNMERWKRRRASGAALVSPTARYTVAVDIDAG